MADCLISAIVQNLHFVAFLSILSTRSLFVRWIARDSCSHLHLFFHMSSNTSPKNPPNDTLRCKRTRSLFWKVNRCPSFDSDPINASGSMLGRNRPLQWPCPSHLTLTTASTSTSTNPRHDRLCVVQTSSPATSRESHRALGGSKAT